MILSPTSGLLHARPARVWFRWVKGHSGDVGNDGSDGLANQGALLPLTLAYHIPPDCPEDWVFTDLVQPIAGSKVVTRLASAPPPPEPLPRGNFPEEGFGVDSHRGRVRTRLVQVANLEDLLQCALRHDKAFWDRIRDWLDAKKPLLAVPLGELAESFHRRMNPPAVLPPQFDGEALANARLLCDTIPSRTVDRTPEHYFSELWDVEDIAWLKEKAREHTGGGTPGIDGTTYKLFLSIPNDALLVLFNTCLTDMDAPHIWLTTLLAGILKAGKSPLDPDSHRLVALESCLLKMKTALIDRRFREWATKYEVLPDSQNGFRPGYRTNNNIFIL